MLVMFAHFVYALLSFSAREFPAQSKTQEPGEVIEECTSYSSQTDMVRSVTYKHFSQYYYSEGTYIAYSDSN